MIWIIAIESIIIVAMSIVILYYRHQMVYWDNKANEIFNELYKWQQKYYGLKQECRIVYARLRKAEKYVPKRDKSGKFIKNKNRYDSDDWN